MKQIKIVASDPQIEIEVPVGNLGAKLVGGLGGFEEVEDTVALIGRTSRQS